MQTLKGAHVPVLGFLGVLLMASQALAAAPTPSSPMSHWFEVPGGGWTLSPNSNQLFNPSMMVSPTTLGHSSGDQAVHAFTVDANGNLWDSFSANPLSPSPDICTLLRMCWWPQASRDVLQPPPSARGA